MVKHLAKTSHMHPYRPKDHNLGDFPEHKACNLIQMILLEHVLEAIDFAKKNYKLINVN